MQLHAELDRCGDSLCVYAGNCEVCNPDGSVTLYDADGDGICDADEVVGCTDMAACNYNELATDDDGSCYFCGCAQLSSDNSTYGLEIDTVATNIGVLSDGTDLTGYSTYRLYVTMPNATDVLSFGQWGFDQSNEYLLFHRLLSEFVGQLVSRWF